MNGKNLMTDFNKRLGEILRKFGENDMNSLLICDDVDDLISQINSLVREREEQMKQNIIQILKEIWEEKELKKAIKGINALRAE